MYVHPIHSLHPSILTNPTPDIDNSSLKLPRLASLLSNPSSEIGFIDVTMSGPSHGATEAAPAVAAIIDQQERSLLRELIGDGKTPEGGGRPEAEEEQEGGEEDDESEPSELKSEERRKKKEKDTGRPAFARAAPRPRKQESSQGFFQHKNNKRGDDIFDTPT
jgi:hypothetical protein